MDSQPAAKKRKLTPAAPTKFQPGQSSFDEVLRRIKEDAGEAKGQFRFNTRAIHLSYPTQMLKVALMRGLVLHLHLSVLNGTASVSLPTFEFVVVSIDICPSFPANRY